MGSTLAAKFIEASAPSEKASKLNQEIEWFMSCTWPRWELLSEAPEDSSALRRHLFKAAKLNMCMYMPGYRQLLRIL